MATEEVFSVFSKVNDDILLNILGRLPAVAFACAACVSRTWNRNCGHILCRPKFVSAMSMNPDPCEAVDEVFNEVFSRPIRPDFAIVYIGMEFSLPLTSLFVFKKLRRGVPIIINQAVGLIGVDIGADEIIEDHRVDIRPIVEKLDYIMPEETAIVGDAKGSFLFRRRDETKNYSGNLFFFDAAALVFARDQNKSDELGETQFHVAVADGIIPFGPQLRSLAVLEDSAQSWIFGIVQGAEDEGYPMLDCLTVLQQLINQLDLGNPDFYIEVSKGRQHSSGFKTTLACHELLGGDHESIIVNGVGIRPGDRFVFFHSDAGNALTRVDDARHSLEALDVDQAVFGGLIFSSYRRGKEFFGATYVDMSPFTDKLNRVPVAGISCTSEIGRGALLGQGLGYCFHAHSCVYLAMSYVPPMSY